MPVYQLKIVHRQRIKQIDQQYSTRQSKEFESRVFYVVSDFVVGVIASM